MNIIIFILNIDLNLSVIIRNMTLYSSSSGSYFLSFYTIISSLFSISLSQSQYRHFSPIPLFYVPLFDIVSFIKYGYARASATKSENSPNFGTFPETKIPQTHANHVPPHFSVFSKQECWSEGDVGGWISAIK